MKLALRLGIFLGVIAVIALVLDNASQYVLLVTAALAVYFVPTAIGWRKRNRDAILALNLLLGWTGIGWVIALIWATTKDPI